MIELIGLGREELLDAFNLECAEDNSEVVIPKDEEEEGEEVTLSERK